MAGTINLRGNWLKDDTDNQSSFNSKELELNSLVDEVSLYLIQNKANLINDIEKNIIDFKVFEDEIRSYINKNKITMKGNSNIPELVRKVKDYLYGYGLIQPLIDSKDITDIKIINKNNVRIKEWGERNNVDINFPSDESVSQFAHYLAVKNGVDLSELTAIQRFTDKSHKDFILRINLGIAPVNTFSTHVAIRKIPKIKHSLEDLVAMDMINLDIYDYLLRCFNAKLNILYCGVGGSGKTTLMNAALDKIPLSESTLVVQEAEELHSSHPDIIFEKSIDKLGESETNYSLDYLLRNGLTMDIDRYIVGEIKGKEASQLWSAMLSGHLIWGSIHSVNGLQACEKLVNYIKDNGTDYTREDLLRMLVNIDVIIYMDNFKVAQIVEVKNYNESIKNLEFNEVFKYITLDQHNGFFKRVGFSTEKINNRFKLYQPIESEVI